LNRRRRSRVRIRTRDHFVDDPDALAVEIELAAASIEKRRFEPPTSSRIALTRESSTIVRASPSTSPVIGVSTTSSTSMVGAGGPPAGGQWSRRAVWI
jgi:hypothetical protein